MPSAVVHRLLVADALEDGVGAEAAGQLAHALDRLLAALADDVGRAELSRQRDPVGMAAEEDDLLGAEPLGGDHAAQADGAVADDGHGLARADLGGDGRVVARPHHVGEGEQRRHQRVVSPTGRTTSVPSACGTRTASPWPPSTPSLAAEAAVQAGRVQPLMAEDAGAVGAGERRDDEVAGASRCGRRRRRPRRRR